MVVVRRNRHEIQNTVVLFVILCEINRFKCFCNNLLSPLVFHTVQAAKGSDSTPVPYPAKRPRSFQSDAGIIIPECFDERIDCCRIFQPSEYFCSLPAVSLLLIRKHLDEICQSRFPPGFRFTAFLHEIRDTTLVFFHRFSFPLPIADLFNARSRIP